MAIGKYLSLREAINEGLLKRFAKEHKTTGDREQFDATLDAMLRKPEATRPASGTKKGGDD